MPKASNAFVELLASKLFGFSCHAYTRPPDVPPKMATLVPFCVGYNAPAFSKAAFAMGLQVGMAGH